MADASRHTLAGSASSLCLPAARSSAAFRGGSRTLQASGLSSLSKAASSPALDTVGGHVSGSQSCLSELPRPLVTVTSAQSSPRSTPTAHGFTSHTPMVMFDMTRQESCVSTSSSCTPSGGQPNLKRTNSMSYKAVAVLKRIKFFQELEPGVQSKLPSIVTMEHVTANTVIFRQDDPPGNCYVLLNGEVGVYANPLRVEEPVSRDEDGEEFFRKPSRMSMIEKFQEIKLERLKAEYEAKEAAKAEKAAEAAEGKNSARNDGEDAALEDDQDAEVGRRRGSDQPPKVNQTTEGFSVWTNLEDLGKKQVSLREGTIFGELALINDQPRGASIRCLTDCALLVIRRSDFNHVLKEEMRRAGDEKLNFLAEHLPGMRDVEVPRQIQGKGQPHPAYYLRRATYRRGHHFFTQGVMAQDAIFVVSKGSVEIRRGDESSPSRSTTRLRTQARQGRSLGMRGYQKQADSNDAAKGGPRILGTLMRGSVLGSMPVQAVEPFSIIVSTSSCEVFQAIGPDVLKLPRRLLEVVRDYIANATAWRLQTYMNHKSSVTVPKALARSESPQVSGGPRTQLEAKCFRLIHAS